MLWSTLEKMNSKQNIIFFDGYCGLCDRFVTEIFRLDRKHVFQFAPLQGPTARQTLLNVAPVDSIIYWKNGEYFLKSAAALEILGDLGGVFSLAGAFKIVPRFVSDWIYDWIAKNRYGWFGKSLSCRLPSENEKAYFLD